MTENQSNQADNFDFYRLVWSETEIRRMHALLRPLEKNEVYFLSLSARNKYLTSDERKNGPLLVSEMFQRKLVKDPSFERFMATLRTYEARRGAYLTTDGKDVPLHVMVVYLCLNPRSSTKALQEFYHSTMADVFANTLSPGLDSQLLTCFQSAKSKIDMIDIDFDVPKGEPGTALLMDFVSVLREKKTDFHVVETRSGFHVLMKRDTVKFNYNEVVARLHKQATGLFGKAEVAVNKADMIPCPGTVQAGFNVKFLDV